MELMPGYKQTEVGVIPEDWDCVSIQRAASNATNAIVGGPFGSDLTSSDYVYSGVPVVRGTNMGSRMIAGPFVFVSTEKAATLTANLARPRDVIFTQRGTLGQVSLVPEVPFESYLISQSQMKVSLDTHRYSPEYAYHYFSSAPGQKQILDSAIQTGVPHTNLGILKKYIFPVPTFAEQLIISAILDDLDSLIEAIDYLLGKKKQIKLAAMQELLTGKRRLPGFEGEWEVKRLGELGEFVKGSGVKKDEAASGDLPCVRYGEIYTHHESYISEFKSHISTTVASRATTIRQGDILFAGSGETKEEIGKAVALSHPVRAFAGGDIVILRQQDADALFLGYRLNAIDISRQKAGLGQGDAVVHISAHALSTISVSLPERAEQEAIASFLYEMDTELRRLQLRLSKTQALKQGMMQQLLTGKIRLK